jgi:hypothetical protein
MKEAFTERDIGECFREIQPQGSEGKEIICPHSWFHLSLSQSYRQLWN